MGMKPINFERVITKSGLSKKEIARQKGVKPETLSRHISGAIRMTFDDAYAYAKILDCPPQDIFFPPQPMPVLGTIKMIDEPKEKAFRTSYVRELWSGKPRFAYTVTSEYAKNWGVFLYEGNEKYTGIMSYRVNQVELVDVRPINQGYVSNRSHQAWSYCKISDDYVPKSCNREKTRIVLTLPFKQPNGLFTLFNPGMNIEVRDVPLDWATPVVMSSDVPSSIFIHIDE